MIFLDEGGVLCWFFAMCRDAECAQETMQRAIEVECVWPHICARMWVG